jgi:hypothetical protein
MFCPNATLSVRPPLAIVPQAPTSGTPIPASFSSKAPIIIHQTIYII